MLVMAACSTNDSNSKAGSSTTDVAAASVGKPLTTEQAAQTAADELGPIKVPTGSTTRGIAAKVIRVGGVATLKDASGVDQLLGACDGAKARFERANREGGVNGYKIDYVGCSDDGQSPERNRDAVHNLVEQKKVFALVPYSSGVSDSGDYLNRARVPYYGWGVSPVDYCGWTDRQFAFSVTQAISCTTAVPGKAFFSSLGISAYLKAAKREPSGVKAAFVGSSDAASATSIKAFKQIGADLGMDVVYAKTPIPGAGAAPLADYTPVAQAVLSSGADFVAIPSLPGPTFSVIAALRAGGYKGDVLIFFFDTRLLVLAKQLDRVYALSPNFGFSGYGGDVYDQMADDLKAIDAKSPVDGAGTLTSYGAADMFLQALADVKGPLTAEALSKVMNGGWDYSPPGTLLCASHWPSSHAVSSTCGGVVQFDGNAGKIEPVLDPGSYGSVYLLPR
jgi:ABC-type branched-subunit amino acid transport system substrate-binding protein